MARRPRIIIAMSVYRWVAAATLMALAVAACGGEDEQPGTVYWGLAEEWPFIDIRWRIALAEFVDEGALLDAAGAAPGSRFVSHEKRVRDAAETPTDPELLRDVMFTFGVVEVGLNILGPEEIGQCRLWVAPRGDVGPSDEVRAQLALGFAETLRAVVLDVFGEDTTPCVLTTDPAATHLFVWVEGDTPPALPCRERATFLGIPSEPDIGFTCS